MYGMEDHRLKTFGIEENNQYQDTAIKGPVNCASQRTGEPKRFRPEAMFKNV